MPHTTDIGEPATSAFPKSVTVEYQIAGQFSEGRAVTVKGAKLTENTAVRVFAEDGVFALDHIPTGANMLFQINPQAIEVMAHEFEKEFGALAESTNDKLIRQGMPTRWADYWRYLREWEPHDQLSKPITFDGWSAQSNKD